MYNNYRVACVVLNYKDLYETEKYIKTICDYGIYDNIIIIDNCSPDNSFEILSKLQNEKVSVFKTDKNGGYGYGNNFGVRKAVELYQSDIVFISNPDISYTEDSVRRIIEKFSDNPLCAVVSSTQYNGFTNERILDCAWKVPTYVGYVIGSLNLLRRVLPDYRYELDEKCKRVDCVPGAFLAVRTEHFLKCGGYDERIFLYCEESTLGYRLKEKGFHSYLLTEEKYYHFASTSIKKSIPSNVARHKLILKSRMFYLKEYLKISQRKMLFARVCFQISIIEEYLKVFVKKLLK